METIVASIGPEWTEKIISQKKTAEVRKSFPGKPPFRVYMYETKGNKINKKKPGLGMVIGYFICDRVYKFLPPYEELFKSPLFEKTCLTKEQIIEYGGNAPLYLWHIGTTKIYYTPQPIIMLGFNAPPQSWFRMRKTFGKV